MEIFPYFSSYILLYSVIAFLLLIIVPAPYGKFAKAYLPLQINSRLAWSFNEIGALVFLLIGYLEDGKWYHDMPSSTKGWACFIFLIVHFLWRSVLSQLVIAYVIDPPNGTKQTSLILPLLGLLYLPFVGMNFRRMSAQIDDTYNFEDNVFLVGACISLCANAFVDIQLNRWRKTEGTQISEYLGIYLSREQIGERFGLLDKLGFQSPNYLFEIFEWGFFTLFAFRWEAFWWFVATILYLLPRSIWTSHWYSIPTKKTTSNVVAKVVSVRSNNNFMF